MAMQSISDLLPGDALEGLADSLAALRPLVEGYITRERVLRYVETLADAPAPSTAAAAIRAPILRDLLEHDGALEGARLLLDPNFRNTGSTVLLTQSPEAAGHLWYFAHLDTISYLVQPRRDGRYPLVPFCLHLIGDGVRAARAYRYDLTLNCYRICAEGELVSEASVPYFVPHDHECGLRPGDRIVPVTPVRSTPDGTFFGQIDNAGGVAALAIAAPVLAQAGIDGMFAFPDEEEGPVGSGSQVMGRGSARIAGMLPPPDLAIIADMQQTGGETDPLGRDESTNATRLGQGAVLSEFSSLARGAVTPPHLYAIARHWLDRVAGLGVKIQESNNAYISRSDDVSVLLKTPNILLLGFPGFNRHFDFAEPRANLFDLVDLAKALVYVSALRPILVACQQCSALR